MVNYFKDKNVLIIGGTGTVGRSILGIILKAEPNVIRIFSRDEHGQFELASQVQQDFTETAKGVRFLIGDVRDYDRVLKAMEDIDFVFNLAAMKHVPSCEYNPFEAVLTNIVGMNNVIRAATVQGAKKVVFTSSDKAIAPTNLYGATKMVAEKLVSSAEYSKGKSQCVFSIVRFGNVIGSRGSVVPLFINQIQDYRKITVTDQNMSRFMMTAYQAAKLSVKALMESQGGEVFVLKMPVVNLGDLVDVLIEETCKKHKLSPDEIMIEKIGLRPGEKKFEELMTYEESLVALENKEMFVIPSLLEKRKEYPGFTKTQESNYSSNNLKPISKSEVRELITSLKIF